MTHQDNCQKKRRTSNASKKSSTLQRHSLERLIHLYLLPTNSSKEPKERKTTTRTPTGKQPLFQHLYDGHSLDFTPCLANEEGVSDFFVSDVYE
mmetsp:Transcript_28460/g.40060  ORF Transcript_28460/g.40060 Transcript_28460/m.40060 type:complete len:94 (+) Transcript_28460:639-920(+)